MTDSTKDNLQEQLGRAVEALYQLREVRERLKKEDAEMTNLIKSAAASLKIKGHSFIVTNPETGTAYRTDALPGGAIQVGIFAERLPSLVTKREVK